MSGTSGARPTDCNINSTRILEEPIYVAITDQRLGSSVTVPCHALSIVMADPGGMVC